MVDTPAPQQTTPALASTFYTQLDQSKIAKTHELVASGKPISGDDQDASYTKSTFGNNYVGLYAFTDTYNDSNKDKNVYAIAINDSNKDKNVYAIAIGQPGADSLRFQLNNKADFDKALEVLRTHGYEGLKEHLAKTGESPVLITVLTNGAEQTPIRLFIDPTGKKPETVFAKLGDQWIPGTVKRIPDGQLELTFEKDSKLSPSDPAKNVFTIADPAMDVEMRAAAVKPAQPEPTQSPNPPPAPDAAQAQPQSPSPPPAPDAGAAKPETPEAPAFPADTAVSGFKFDSAKLTPAMEKQWKEFADKFKAAHPNEQPTVFLNGFADPKGSRAYNLRLGMARAEAVQQFLKKQGITAEVGTGGAGQLADPKNDSKNRRVTAYVGDDAIKDVTQANAAEAAAASAEGMAAQRPAAAKAGKPAPEPDKASDHSGGGVSDPTAYFPVKPPAHHVYHTRPPAKPVANPGTAASAPASAPAQSADALRAGSNDILTAIDKGEYPGGYYTSTGVNNQTIGIIKGSKGGYTISVAGDDHRTTGPSVNVSRETALEYLDKIQENPRAFAETMPTIQIQARANADHSGGNRTPLKSGSESTQTIPGRDGDRGVPSAAIKVTPLPAPGNSMHP